MKKTSRNFFGLLNAQRKSLVKLLMFIVLWFGVFSLQAQSKHYVVGNMYIDTAGFAYISTGDTANLEGNITTVRDITAAKRGMLSFADNSDWESSNNSFVNGYVRSHKAGDFIFPIGQTGYRPAAISTAADAAPTDAAYYNPALYDITAVDTEIGAVSNESWVIQGTVAANITLTWSNDITAFADRLDRLTVVGWNGTKWVAIVSAVDPVSPIFGTVSNLSANGSITTVSALVPNDYLAYTLGRIEPQLCEPPINLFAVAENNTIIITWDEPENIDGDLSGYNIYRNEEKINEKLLTETEYIDKELPDGTYLYQVSAVYEHCEESKLTEGFEIIYVGIADIQTSFINIYPNPATGEFTITNYKLQITNVEIYDTYGRNVLTNHIVASSSNHLINISHLQAGIYFVRIYSETKQVVVKRLVKF